MARIFVDGFESGDLGLWSGAYSNLAVISTTVPTGMSGTYTLWCDSYYGLYKMFSASQTEIYMAFKYYPTHADYSRSLISFRDSVGTQIYALRRNQTSGFVETHVGNSYGTLVSTGTIPIIAGSTYLIEIRYKPLNTGGILTTKINGVQDINYSGDTTNGLENVKQFILGYDGAGSPETIYSYYDDIVVDDANWIGNTRIQAIVPTGTGTTSQYNAVLNAHPVNLSLANAGGVTGPYANLRTIIAGSYITHSGSRIKLGFYPYSASDTNIIECSIGPRDGTTTTFLSAPTKITKGGSNSFTIMQGGTVQYSDWITFDLVANTDYLVHFYLYGSTCTFGQGIVTEALYYEANADANDTESLTISGYSSRSNERALIVRVFVENSEHTYNYKAVMEKPASDFDYIKTGSSQIDTYAMGNLTGSISLIKSVAVQTRNWREGNGSYDRAQHIVRPASTDRLSASTPIFPISATSFQSIWELNPEDSQAWEEADINGMEAGIKAVTA